ncbi:unnamed protein product, partial [Staurois parvus]
LNPQQYNQSVYAVKHAFYTHCRTQGVNPLHCVKMQFYPDFSDPPLRPVPPSYLMRRHIAWSHSAHA